MWEHVSTHLAHAPPLGDRVPPVLHQLYREVLGVTSALPDFRKITGARDARNALWIDNSMAHTPLFMERLASCADPPRVASI